VGLSNVVVFVFKCVFVYFCDQQIMDEKKMPHLCVFALTKIKPIIPKKKSYQSLWTSMQE